jgi:hypothetical protein
MMTHCLRPILLGGALLVASACASGDYDTWVSHPTHYASGQHWGFSARNVGVSQTSKVSAEDVAAAQKEQWWGRGVTAMMAGEGGAPATAVAGFWRGSWAGPGLSNVVRSSGMQAELFVNPDGYGRGRIALADTTAVEGVPWSLRQAGSAGVPVWVKVDGNRVLLRQAEEPASASENRFSAEFAVQGDRMEGHFRHMRYPNRMTLVRVP